MSGFLIIFLSLIFITPLFSIDNSDSLFNVLAKKYPAQKETLRRLVPKQREITYKEVSKIRQEISDLEKIADPDRGVMFKNLGDMYLKSKARAKSPKDSLAKSMLIGIYAKTITLLKEKENSVLIATYNNLATTYHLYGELRQAKDNFYMSLEIAKKINSVSDVIITYTNLSNLNLHDGKLNEALDNRLDQLKHLERTKDKKQLSECYSSIGQIYYKLGDYNRAAEYYNLDIKMREETGETKDLDEFLYRLGKIYSAMDNPSKALEFYKKAYDLFTANYNKDQYEDRIKLGQYLTSFGKSYYDLNNFKKAEEYYQKALNIVEGDSSEKGMQGYALLLNNLGLIYKSKGSYEQALSYVQKSIQIREKLGNLENVFYPLTSIAEIFMKVNNNEQALNYLFRALDIARTLKRDPLKQIAYFLLHEVYKSMGDYRQALNYYEMHTAIKDSLLNTEINNKISELQVKFETEQKERENSALRRANMLQEQANEMQRLFIIIISCLALIIIISIYLRYRNRQKVNKQLEDKNRQIEEKRQELEELNTGLEINQRKLIEANATKDKFFSIIAHDLKNPMHTLTFGSEMLMTYFDKFEREQLKEHITSLNKTTKLTADLLENLLQWSRTQRGLIEHKPTNVPVGKMIEEISELNSEIAKSKSISLKREIEGNYVCYADIHMLETTLRNLISNAIKFTFEGGLVTVGVKNGSDSELLFYVSDTGMGISAENVKSLFKIDTSFSTMGTNKEKGTGLGLIITKEFVTYNGGRIWLESELEKGTTFYFTVPKAS